MAIEDLTDLNLVFFSQIQNYRQRCQNNAYGNLVRKGVGVYESKTGVQIEGIWVTEVNVTNAVLKDEQGIVWRGSLKSLKPHGLMAVRLPSGHEYDGVWDNGTLQRLLSVENKSNAKPNRDKS